MTSLMILDMKLAVYHMTPYKEMCQDSINQEQQIATLIYYSPPLYRWAARGALVSMIPPV